MFGSDSYLGVAHDKSMSYTFNSNLCVCMSVCLPAKLIDLHSKHNPFIPFYSSLTPTGLKSGC
jgi:hypothetical protein